MVRSYMCASFEPLQGGWPFESGYQLRCYAYMWLLITDEYPPFPLR